MKTRLIILLCLCSLPLWAAPPSGGSVRVNIRLSRVAIHRTGNININSRTTGANLNGNGTIDNPGIPAGGTMDNPAGNPAQNSPGTTPVTIQPINPPTQPSQNPIFPNYPAYLPVHPATPPRAPVNGGNSATPMNPN